MFTGLAPGSEQAVDLMHLTAGNVERRVMLTDGFLVRPLKQAVDLPISVVEQLDLSHPELVGHAVSGSLRDLVDRLLRQLEVVVEVHEPRHVVPLRCHVATTLPAASQNVQRRRPRRNVARGWNSPGRPRVPTPVGALVSPGL